MEWWQRVLYIGAFLLLIQLGRECVASDAESPPASRSSVDLGPLFPSSTTLLPPPPLTDYFPESDPYGDYEDYSDYEDPCTYSWPVC